MVRVDAGERVGRRFLVPVFAGGVAALRADDMTYVAFMIMSADLKTLELYLVGDVKPADDGKGFVMIDDHSDMTVPFTINNTEEGFELGFKDGDVAKMEGVPQKTILDDMLGIIEATMD